MFGLNSSVAILWFSVSILQFFALMDGFAYWFGTNAFINFILALILGGIPFLGTIGGMFGAIQIWDWSFLQAFLLFFGPLIAAIIFAILSSKSN